MSDTNKLRARIADELNRTDLSAQINREINAAIRHYESHGWWWQEARDKLICVTSPGTRYYSLTADILKPRSLKLKYNNSYIPMYPKTFDEMDRDDRQITTTDGASTQWVVYGTEIRLFPVPDATRSVIGSVLLRPRLTSLTGSYCASQTLTPTTTTSHNNRIDGWTTDAEELIRARAVASVRINYLNMPGAIAEMNQLSGQGYLSHRERLAYQSLRDEVTDRQSAGKLRPYL